MTGEAAAAAAKAEPTPPARAPAAGARPKIRPARPGDLDALVALEDKTFTTDRLSRRSFRRFIASRTNVLLVAAEGGSMLGYGLVLLRCRAAVARLYSIAVDPKARGRGVARALVSACEEAAARRGALAMRLEVQVRNSRALRLYEKQGYRPFGHYRAYYGDGSDALRLKKSLGGAVAAGVKRKRPR